MSPSYTGMFPFLVTCLFWPPVSFGHLCFSLVPVLCIVHVVSCCYPVLHMRESGVSDCLCRYIYIFIYIYICKKNDKTASNTLNTYLYCCKSLPRTVNQILHLPLSLRSKNSLHGLRRGGFWIATPLSAKHTPPRHDITCTASYSALCMREAGVEMPKTTRKPSLKVRKNLQIKRFVPTTILLLSKEG